ncbi:MAG: PEP-CTERM sorting domain-containing protein [Terrimicrobiaceae bacterium]
MKMPSFTCAALTLAAGFFASLGGLNAQIEQILPANYGVTGIRQDTGGNVLLSGGTGSPSLNTATPAFLYYGPLNSASIPTTVGGTGLYTYTPNFGSGAITGGAQFYGPNTNYYNPAIGAGNVTVVGAYKATAGATYQNGMIYHGPLNGSGTWTSFEASGNGINSVGDTIPHSTMGTLIVGNYDYQGSEAVGHAFIYDTAQDTFMDLPYGTYSNTAYGIWQNDDANSNSYTIVGGFSDIINGGKGYIVNYNSATQNFTNFTALSFDNNPTLITHFEGISTVAGGFSLTSTTVQGAGYAFVPVNNDGSFGTVTWTAVTNQLSPGASTTGDTVINNTVLGVYSTGGGGVASYMTTVPEPSSFVLLGFGAFALSMVKRRRIG